MEFTTLNIAEMLEINGGWSRRDTRCVIGAGSSALAGAATGNLAAFIGSAGTGIASFCL